MHHHRPAFGRLIFLKRQATGKRTKMPGSQAVLESVRSHAAKLVVAFCRAGVMAGGKQDAQFFARTGAGAADHPAGSTAALAPDPAGAAGVDTRAGGAVLGSSAPAAAGPALLLLVLPRSSAPAAGEAEIIASSPAPAAWARHIGAAIDSSLAPAAVALQSFFIFDEGDASISELRRVRWGVPTIFPRFADPQRRNSPAFTDRQVLRKKFFALQVLFLAKDCLRCEVGWQKQALPPSHAPPYVEDPRGRWQWPSANPRANPFFQDDLTQ